MCLYISPGGRPPFTASNDRAAPRQITPKVRNKRGRANRVSAAQGAMQSPRGEGGDRWLTSDWHEGSRPIFHRTVFRAPSLATAAHFARYRSAAWAQPQTKRAARKPPKPHLGAATSKGPPRSARRRRACGCGLRRVSRGGRLCAPQQMGRIGLAPRGG
jgi:hypothetical protein